MCHGLCRARGQLGLSPAWGRSLKGMGFGGLHLPAGFLIPATQVTPEPIPVHPAQQGQQKIKFLNISSTSPGCSKPHPACPQTLPGIQGQPQLLGASIPPNPSHATGKGKKNPPQTSEHHKDFIINKPLGAFWVIKIP